MSYEWSTGSAPFLVGRCFHVFDRNSKVERQGIVVETNGEWALVQYFEWFTGSLNTMSLVRLRDMRNDHPEDGGHWQFYADAEHMNEWYESHPGAHQ